MNKIKLVIRSAFRAVLWSTVAHVGVTVMMVVINMIAHTIVLGVDIRNYPLTWCILSIVIFISLLIIRKTK